MVVVIKKEDLLPVAPMPTAVGTGSTLDKATALINQIDVLTRNPFIQGLLTRLLSKFGLAQNPTSSQPSLQTSQPIDLNAENIYTLVLEAVDTILKMFGDLPLSKVKEQLIANKDQVVRMIGEKVAESKK